MSDDPNPGLAEIQKTYDLLDDNFDAAYAKCDPGQKITLTKARDDAKAAFWSTVGKTLASNDPDITATVTQLKTSNDQIQTQLASLQDIASTLDTITQGVKLATSLAAMAAA